MTDHATSSPPSPPPPRPPQRSATNTGSFPALDDDSPPAVAHRARRGERIAVETREALHAAIGRRPDPLVKDDKGEGILGNLCEIKAVVDVILANQAARAKWVNVVLMVAVGFCVTSGLAALVHYLGSFHR